MGILDLHFHDSEFTFAPSATMSGSDETESSSGQKMSGKLPKIGLGRSRSSKESESSSETTDSSGASETTTTEMSDTEESESSSGGSKAKKGIGALVGLVFLVGIAVVMKQRRGGQESDDMDIDEYGSEEYGSDSSEESIEIAD